MDVEVTKLVLDITRLALQLNPTQTKQEITGDKPTVFLEFLGHTCCLNVKVCENGWECDTPFDARFNVWFDEEDAREKLEEIYDYLLNLRSEN